MHCQEAAHSVVGSEIAINPEPTGTLFLCFFLCSTRCSVRLPLSLCRGFLHFQFAHQVTFARVRNGSEARHARRLSNECGRVGWVCCLLSPAGASAARLV
jgi:hypothetical protein